MNAFKRLQQCRAWGIDRLIFEDNYSPGMGDTPSLRQMLAGTYDGWGPSRLPPGGSVNSRLKRALRPLVARFEVLAERYDPLMLRDAIASIDLTYEEFPAIAVFQFDRGGHPWKETYGNARPCLDLSKLTPEQRAVVEAEGRYYTSICAVRPSGGDQ